MSLDAPAPIPFVTSLDRVWDALESHGYRPQKRGNSFKALCPIHEDGKPSLHVTYDRSDGKTMLWCFGCRAHYADIAAAIGLTVGDLFDAPLPEGYRRKSSDAPRPKRPTLPPRLTRDEARPKAPDLSDADWKEVRVYSYVDEAGTEMQRVSRFETELDGKRHKEFRQAYRGTKGQWLKRRPEDFAPLLYNLPAVVKAAAAGGDVWLLEGEKDVDNAVDEGLVATTNAGGANTFPESLLQRLVGAHVHLVVDNDLAGYQRAVSITEQLTDLGVDVTTYLPAPTEAKADFTDHLDAGGTIDTLVKISVDDARALVAMAAAVKQIERVEVCRREAFANLELDEKQQAHEVSESNAELWARESAERLDVIARTAPADTADYSERGAEAMAEFYSILDKAAHISAGTFTIAGLPVPSHVLDAQLAEATSQADTTTPAAAGDDEAEGAEKKPSRVKFGEPGEAAPAAGDGSGGNIPHIHSDEDDDDERAPFIIQTEYAVVNGLTVRVQRDVLSDGTVRKKYYRIMGGWGEVISEAVEDDGSDSEVARPAHTITVKFHRPFLSSRGRALRDPETKRILSEEAIVKFSDEQVRDGSWARALPWPDFLESTTRNALTNAWSAIYRAKPTIKARSTVYTSIGWRDGADGPTFVHAKGAITTEGTRKVDVDVAAPYEVCQMPDPLEDPDELRAAWLEGTIALKDSGLLQRVLAPLLGHSWGAVLAPSDMLMHLAGGRASFKSAHARVACQYFAPQLHFRGTKEMLSGANQGTTTIGLIRALGGASHIPVLVDDFAPDGDAKKAQKKLSELARTVFNGIGRITGKQRGGISVDRPIEASIITTGELTATGSGDTRIVNLPLDPRSTDNGRALFAELESRKQRHARGLLGATLIQWVSRRRAELLAELEESDDDAETSKFNSEAFWEKQLASLPHDAGLLGRLINAAVSLDRGISLMLRMLRDYEAITDVEAREFYAWAREGIHQAICLQDSSAGDPAESLLSYLREAIASRKVYISEDDGNAPVDAASYGWLVQGVGEYQQVRPANERIGVIKRTDRGDRLYLLPTQSIATANMMAARADETFSETPVSIGSALVAHGWVTRNNRGEAATQRRFAGQQVRVWDIPLSVFIDDGNPGDDGDNERNARTPDGGLPPGLFDMPKTDLDEPGTPDAPAGSDDAGAPPIGEPPVEEPPFEDPQVEDLPQVAETPAPAEQPTAAPAAEAAVAKSAPLLQPGSFRASLAVLDVDGLWLPDGERIEISEPIVHIGQLAQLASHLRLGTQINKGANKLRKTERGQVYVTEAAAIEMGIPFDQLPPSGAFQYLKKLHEATQDHPFVVRAREAGFQVSGKGAIDPSLECWHDGNRDLGVLVSFLTAQHSKFHTSVLSGEPAPADIARRLQKFTTALQFPYRKNPSTTGLDLMFALHPKDDKEKLFSPMPSPQVVSDTNYREVDFDWQRKLTEAEREHKWVHAFDRGGSYLAAAAGIDLPVGAATHYPEGVAYSNATRLPGYWKITTPEAGSWLMPDPIATAGRAGVATAGRQMWVTTPTMELAAELEIELEVHEAYLWHEKQRLLGTWQQRMRDARESLDTFDPDDQVARDLLKSVYVSGLGITASHDNRSGMMGYAPIRYEMIQAKSRANIIRRILQIGRDTDRWPVAIVKDAILYTSNEVDADKAWPGKTEHFGRGLGQYKYEGSATVAEQLEFFTGTGAYTGKKHMQELI